MRDLHCECCSKLLIEDFWVMVEAEVVSTFASITIDCECGHTMRVTPLRKPRWRRLADIRPLLAPG